MSFLQRLWRAEATALVALLICAAGVAAYGGLDTVRAAQSSRMVPSKPLFSPTEAAWIGFAYTVMIGFLPALIYGAPVYAFVSLKRRASWLVVIGMGLLPGILMLPFDCVLATWALVCGVFVATMTHALMRHWTRRSNSMVDADAPEIPRQ
jgi:hypothetical protein